MTRGDDAALHLVGSTAEAQDRRGTPGALLAAFARREDPALLERVLAEHASALEAGVNGVPAVMIEGQDVPLTGALPIEMFERWIERNL